MTLISRSRRSILLLGSAIWRPLQVQPTPEPDPFAVAKDWYSRVGVYADNPFTNATWALRL